MNLIDEITVEKQVTRTETVVYKTELPIRFAVVYHSDFTPELKVTALFCCQYWAEKFIDKCTNDIVFSVLDLQTGETVYQPKKA